jgi:hypothetical protein
MLKKVLKLKYNFNPVLHNRAILYFFFAIALIDLIYFLNVKDLFSFSVLILVGILTSFFNKNMIVILFVSIIFTHILKYGRSSFSEGLDNMDKPEKQKDTSDADGKKNDGVNKDEVVDNLSDNIKNFSKKIDDLAKTKDNKRAELIENLQDMKDTRDQIVDNVKSMQPLLDKFQGYVDKFNEYKKSTNNNALNGEPVNIAK